MSIASRILSTMFSSPHGLVWFSERDMSPRRKWTPGRVEQKSWWKSTKLIYLLGGIATLMGCLVFIGVRAVPPIPRPDVATLCKGNFERVDRSLVAMDACLDQACIDRCAKTTLNGLQVWHQLAVRMTNVSSRYGFETSQATLGNIMINLENSTLDYAPVIDLTNLWRSWILDLSFRSLGDGYSSVCRGETKISTERAARSLNVALFLETGGQNQFRAAVSSVFSNDNRCPIGEFASVETFKAVLGLTTKAGIPESYLYAFLSAMGPNVVTVPVFVEDLALRFKIFRNESLKHVATDEGSNFWKELEIASRFLAIYALRGAFYDIPLWFKICIQLELTPIFSLVHMIFVRIAIKGIHRLSYAQTDITRQVLKNTYDVLYLIRVITARVIYVLVFALICTSMVGFCLPLCGLDLPDWLTSCLLTRGEHDAYLKLMSSFIGRCMTNPYKVFTSVASWILQHQQTLGANIAPLFALAVVLWTCRQRSKIRRLLTTGDEFKGERLAPKSKNIESFREHIFTFNILNLAVMTMRTIYLLCVFHQTLLGGRHDLPINWLITLDRRAMSLGRN